MHHDPNRRIILGLVIATSLWGVTTQGQPPVPVGEEIGVAEGIARASTPPRVAADGQGRFIVVWEDASLLPGSNATVVGRRLAADGEPIGGVFSIASQDGIDQRFPSVSTLHDDGFVVVWSREQANAPPSIAAQLFSSTGVRQGDTFQVNVEALEGDRSGSAVTTLESGDFVVVWRNTEDADGPGYPANDFVAQRFSSDGSRQGDEIEVTGGASQRNDSVAIASTPNGGFVVAWRSTGYYGYYSANSRVLARAFDSGGESLGDVFQVNSDTDRSNSPSSIAVDEKGNFLVVWSRTGPLGDPPPTEARGRFVDPGGMAVGEEVSFSPNGGGPAAEADLNGNFLVVWSDGLITPSSGFEVVGQRWSSESQPLSDVEILNTSTLGSQFSPAIATALGGDTLAVWREHLHDGYHLRSRRFLTPCRADGDTLCLGAERFRVDLDWTDFGGQRGRGQVVPVASDDSGLLWFFEADNWEMLVKVLDGCAFNGHYWVFAAATTNVQYSLRVTDTNNGQMKIYNNALGSSAPTLTDIMAFPTCP